MRWFAAVPAMCAICGNSADFSIFSMTWYCRIQSSACANDKKYHDVVFVGRFRYQLTMFGNRVLIWYSRLLHARIAYEIDTVKIIAAFCRISYSLHDLIRLNSIVCHVQTKRCSITWFSPDRFRYQLTMFEVCTLIRLSRLLNTHIAFEIVI